MSFDGCTQKDIGGVIRVMSWIEGPDVFYLGTPESFYQDVREWWSSDRGEQIAGGEHGIILDVKSTCYRGVGKDNQRILVCLDTGAVGWLYVNEIIIV